MHTHLNFSSCRVTLAIFTAAIASTLQNEQCRAEGELPKLTEVLLASSLDGEKQPVLYWAPADAETRTTPLFVFLHSWSGDYRQNNNKWHSQAVKRGWIYIHPNFRGVNRTPKACGSKFARQDILDAVDFATSKFKVDRERIYLAGTSGGGHMAMLMAGHHPDRFSAVSAWVGISDLAEWYQFHVKDGEPQKYARMILSSLGAAPGTNENTDADYRDRSPLFHLHRVGQLPIQICAGINDGHSGSVPVSHSILAFNRIAGSHGNAVVGPTELKDLLDRKINDPDDASPCARAPSFERDILFSRCSQNASLIIFDGGHEGLPDSSCEWLAQATRRISENAVTN